MLNFTLDPGDLVYIIQRCPDIRELFISTSKSALESAICHLAGTPIEVLHVTGEESSLPRESDLVRLAHEVQTLSQVGAGNRVYEVHRRGPEVRLERWAGTGIPRYFQVWRG
jgi:hypothetical protein